MADVEELVVRAKPEGLDETADGFDQMQNELEESEEAMAGTTDQFGELTDEWTGLMGVLVAGIGVAVGGILSQVPILKQAIDGLVAVASGLGLQLDQLIRDLGGGKLIQLFFKFGNAVASADGALGDLLGLLTAVGATILGYVAAVKAGIASGGALASIWGTLTTVGSAIMTVLTGLAAVLGVSVGAVAALAAGVALLVGILVTDFLGIRTKLIGFITSFAGMIAKLAVDIGSAAKDIAMKIADWISDKAISAAKWAKNIIIDFANGLGKKTKQLATELGNIEDKVINTISDTAFSAYKWGKNLIQEFINGIKSKASDLGGVVGGLAEEVKDRLQGNSPPPKGPLSNFDQAGPTLVETFSQGMNASVGQVQGAANNVANNASPGSGDFVASMGRPQVIMNGRDVTDEESRYRADELSRLGRNG